jgi:hypothetical protein
MRGWGWPPRYWRPGQDAPLRERINQRIRDTQHPYSRRTKSRRGWRDNQQRNRRSGNQKPF